MKINGSPPVVTAAGNPNIIEIIRQRNSLQQVREVARRVWGESLYGAHTNFFIRLEKLASALQDKATASGRAADFKLDRFFSAVALAIEFHHYGKEPYRKSGEPYPYHMLSILERLTENDFPYLGWRAYVAAWLHDTLEDTALTYEDIKGIFDERVANIVRVLSKIKVSRSAGSSDFVRKMWEVNLYDPFFIREVQDNIEAVYLKLADIDNFVDTLNENISEDSRFLHWRFVDEILFPLAFAVVGAAEPGRTIANKAMAMQLVGSYKSYQAKIDELATQPVKDNLNRLTADLTAELAIAGLPVKSKLSLMTPYELLMKVEKHVQSFGSLTSTQKSAVRCDFLTRLTARDILFIDLFFETDRHCLKGKSVIEAQHSVDPQRTRVFLGKTKKPNGYQGLHLELVGSPRLRLYSRQMDQTNRLGFLPNRLTAAGLPSVRSPALAKRSLELITKSERYTRARLMQRLRFIRTVTVEIKDKNGQAVSPTVQTDVFQGDNWYDLLILACHKNDPTLVWRLASATYNDQEFQLPSGHECGVFSGWFIDGAWHEVPDKRYNWLTFGLNWSYGQRVSLTLHTKLPKTLVNPYGLTNNPVAANYLQKSVTKLARELQARIGRGMIEALFKSNKYDFADIAVDPFIKYLNNDRPNRNWPTLKRLCANLAESFRWSSAEDFFCQVAQGKITLAVIEKAL